MLLCTDGGHYENLGLWNCCAVCAISSAGFPNDSTGDQFFNAAQFDSYQALGYFIGQNAVHRNAGPKPTPPWLRRVRVPWHPPPARDG